MWTEPSDEVMKRKLTPNATRDPSLLWSLVMLLGLGTAISVGMFEVVLILGDR